MTPITIPEPDEDDEKDDDTVDEPIIVSSWSTGPANIKEDLRKATELINRTGYDPLPKAVYCPKCSWAELEPVSAQRINNRGELPCPHCSTPMVCSDR